MYQKEICQDFTKQVTKSFSFETKIEGLRFLNLGTVNNKKCDPRLIFFNEKDADNF